MVVRRAVGHVGRVLTARQREHHVPRGSRGGKGRQPDEAARHEPLVVIFVEERLYRFDLFTIHGGIVELAASKCIGGIARLSDAGRLVEDQQHHEVVGAPGRAAVVGHARGARRGRIVPSILHAYLDRFVIEGTAEPAQGTAVDPAPERAWVALQFVHQRGRRRPARAVGAVLRDDRQRHQRARQAAAARAGPGYTGRSLRVIVAPLLNAE